MEALRRLRRSSSDTNVDRRLVTNVVLSFLNTPRADSKRFEMLSLLANVLSWSDDEREKAGLQRSGGVAPSSSGSLLWGRSAASSPASRPAELQKTDETEVCTFVRSIWVHILIGTTVVLPPMGRVPSHGGFCRRRIFSTTTLAIEAERIVARHSNTVYDTTVTYRSERNPATVFLLLSRTSKLSGPKGCKHTAERQGEGTVLIWVRWTRYDWIWGTQDPL